MRQRAAVTELTPKDGSGAKTCTIPDPSLPINKIGNKFCAYPGDPTCCGGLMFEGAPSGMKPTAASTQLCFPQAATCTCNFNAAPGEPATSCPEGGSGSGRSSGRSSGSSGRSSSSSSGRSTDYPIDDTCNEDDDPSIPGNPAVCACRPEASCAATPPEGPCPGIIVCLGADAVDFCDCSAFSVDGERPRATVGDYCRVVSGNPDRLVCDDPPLSVMLIDDDCCFSSPSFLLSSRLPALANFSGWLWNSFADAHDLCPPRLLPPSSLPPPCWLNAPSLARCRPAT